MNLETLGVSMYSVPAKVLMKLLEAVGGSITVPRSEMLEPHFRGEEVIVETHFGNPAIEPYFSVSLMKIWKADDRGY